MVPIIWLALIGAIYSQIAPFFALNHIFFPANEEATLKTKQPIRFQGFFKVTNQIAGKWKTKSIMLQILQLLFPKLFFLSPQKMDEFNLKLAQYCINQIFELTKSPVLSNFGLKSHLWLQIKLALCAHLILKSRIWFQPQLHSIQFNYHYKLDASPS